MRSFTTTTATTLTLLLALTARALGGTLPLGIRDDSASGVQHKGDITYYNTQNGMGACGKPLSDSEPICALSTELYDQFSKNGNPNNNALCGKKITISMPGVVSQEVTVADRCAACKKWDIDLTPTTFKKLVKNGEKVGRTSVTWSFTH